MTLPARSLASMAALGLTLSVGAATGASAHTNPGGCGTPATPANPTPGEPGATPAIPADPARCAPGPDNVLGTADDVPLAFLRANTGAGGQATSASDSTVVLVGGGLLALGAAFGVRRASRGAKA